MSDDGGGPRFDRLLAAEAVAFADAPGSRPAGASPWAEG